MGRPLYPYAKRLFRRAAWAIIFVSRLESLALGLPPLYKDDDDIAIDMEPPILVDRDRVRTRVEISRPTLLPTQRYVDRYISKNETLLQFYQDAMAIVRYENQQILEVD